jgi:YVTN family beta-propeller protein
MGSAPSSVSNKLNNLNVCPRRLFGPSGGVLVRHSASRQRWRTLSLASRDALATMPIREMTAAHELAAGRKERISMSGAKINLNSPRSARSLQAAVLSLLIWASLPMPAGAQAPGSQAANMPIVYVSNAGGGITEVNTTNNSVIATAPFRNNANGVVVTPDGRRMYASNRDVPEVTVFDATTNVPLKVISVGNGSQDNLGIAISPDGRLVYVANQASGTVTVIATATDTVIQTIPTGLQPIWITFSADSSRAYISNQVSGTVSVIATASGTVINTFGAFSCPFESKLTLDGSKLLVSSQCDNTLKVVDLAKSTVISSIPTGPNPRGIALTPDGKRAYVADWFSNTVDVIDVAALTNLNTPIIVGSQPWGMAMTPEGKAYVANFGDGTISVIDSATNSVTATLHARVFPEDVTVSTTAQPQILGYSFQPLADPPGSLEAVPQSINNRGQIVGWFRDTTNIFHGYLRQTDGSFVTVDPPGSIFTVAYGLNDAGTAVGVWQAAGGAFHGFVRSPSGLYATSDFPGAVDSEFTAINSMGASVGVYDLGDLTANIAFLEAHGAFNSFEDPAAAPMETAALGINSEDFISGFFDDHAGNEHSFVRAPNAQFNNFDFPVADFTDAYKINDSGTVVGQYATNFPAHGFVLSGALAGAPSPCQFLSFDYPDSRNSGARGVNNLGQVTGLFRAWNSPARHGFLATPTARTSSNQSNQCEASIAIRHGVSFESFDFPGAINTQATAITPSGLIVGRYNSPDGIQHGFTLLNGSYSSVDGPGANFTDVAWANARGDLVGSFNDSRGSHAYVLSRGVFKTIDSPIAALPFIAGFGLSNGGDVVGVLFGDNFFQGRGYIFSNNAFALIDVPGAMGTFPTMALDPTRIVGTYVDSSNRFHGFSLANGNFTTVDVPNSTFTWITGINPEGDLVGFYFDQGGNQHGFVQRDSSFITVDVPVPGASLSNANGIDPQSDVVGRYNSADGKTHGYFLGCVACSHHDKTGLNSLAQ